jgi:hypothetical protein
MLLTAAAGSKVTLTFPFGPKPKKFIRRGMMTERNDAWRPDFGGFYKQGRSREGDTLCVMIASNYPRISRLISRNRCC